MAVVVVESPAKAKTINKYLGPGYTVLASYGHVRDLPAKDGSVDPDHDFAMTLGGGAADSQKHIRAIAEALKDDGKLILATDPDREGEAISWHLLEALTGRQAVKKDTAGRARRLQRHHQARGHQRDGEARARSTWSWSTPTSPAARSTISSASALAGALAQAARRQVRRPGPVGGAAADRRPRDGDRGLPRPRVLDGQGAARHPARRHLRGPPRHASTAASSTSSTSPTEAAAEPRRRRDRGARPHASRRSNRSPRPATRRRRS